MLPEISMEPVSTQARARARVPRRRPVRPGHRRRRAGRAGHLRRPAARRGVEQLEREPCGPAGRRRRQAIRLLDQSLLTGEVDGAAACFAIGAGASLDKDRSDPPCGAAACFASRLVSRRTELVELSGRTTGRLRYTWPTTAYAIGRHQRATLALRYSIISATTAARTRPQG